MIVRVFLISLTCISVAACATPTPQSTLDAYANALNANSAAQLVALSDTRFRLVYDAEQVAAYLKKHPKEAAELAKSLSEAPLATAVRASIELNSGHVVHFVLEDGAWRIRAGGIRVDRFDTPKASLSSFFRAYRDGRLSILRHLIPNAHARRYIDDDHLESHMDTIRARVQRAENRIPPDAKVVQEGDTAQIPYGEGWMVRFLKEGNVWKISDLE